MFAQSLGWHCWKPQNYKQNIYDLTCPTKWQVHTHTLPTHMCVHMYVACKCGIVDWLRLRFHAEAICNSIALLKSRTALLSFKITKLTHLHTYIFSILTVCRKYLCGKCVGVWNIFLKLRIHICIEIKPQLYIGYNFANIYLIYGTIRPTEHCELFAFPTNLNMWSNFIVTKFASNFWGQQSPFNSRPCLLLQL